MQETSGDPSTAWMQNNFNQLKDRNLQQLCIPGSHDAGMSSFGAHTFWVNSYNTQTQSGGILHQLSLGARFFDIRPVISSGEYYTGHYTDVGGTGKGYQGANGQSIKSIVQDINNYTANNNELVILYVWAALNTDFQVTTYIPFTQDQWIGLFNELLQIKDLYVSPNPMTDDLTTLPLSDFIGDNKAAVVVVVALDQGITLGNYANQGFYLDPTNFNKYDQYSNTDILSNMISEQLQKMNAFWVKNPHPNSLFLSSWTLTLQTGDIIDTDLGNSNYSILNYAAKANSSLNQLLEACTSQCYPNIILTDDVPSNIMDIVMQINTQVINK
jgi:hypothetical protein